MVPCSSLRISCACVCGTYYHLQNPAGDPQSETELNCYLAAPFCINLKCGRPRQLLDQLIPDPADFLWVAPSPAAQEVS